MENTRPILYGVADYAQIRKKNGWFIDRTAKIRDLEATACAMFLRPRRFGKSLFVSLLEYYYDLKFKDRFDELFGSTAIGAAPTEEHSGYLILKFDFSAVSKDIHAVENDFNAYTGLCCDAFARRYAGLIPDAYSDVHRIDERVFAINDGLVDFSYDGKWTAFIGVLASIVKENFAVRDSVEGEKVVQSTLVALLTAAGGPYFVRHEREAGGGFYDIALVPQLSRWPDIAHAALIEMKYVKAGDPKPTPEQLAKIKSEATEQLDQYSASRDLAAEWHVGSGVSLHRIVLVFHGGECALNEEV